MTDEKGPDWAEAVVKAFIPGHIYDDDPRRLTPYQRWLQEQEEWEE